ncbi:hypothetical protein PRZ48_006947 [Zasmidium cellare]|uniref:Uncharacterized protein n=1 Tax=Zasmidium cellare TaxID=395010 RepID=A0ABR0EIS6_ZASCE|nr:hypothetical protein PRZ48_006947 [Zasmidium cellare]
MADREQTAAERVFSLPEILEYILLFLAYSAINPPDNASNIEGLQVLMCLAAVQRVNTAFHDIIKSSKKIQRLMTAPLESQRLMTGSLESQTALHGVVPLFKQCIWLYLLGIEEDSSDDYQIQIEELTPETCEMLKSNKYKEGSWRNVRLKADPTAKFDVGVVPRPHGSCTWDLAYYEWNLKGDATLGELVDFYLEMVQFEQTHETVWQDGTFRAVEV